MKDQDGKVVFSKTEEYITNDFYVKDLDPKPEEVMLQVWRYDRQVHMREGIDPLETKSYTFAIPLEEGTKSVDVQASFRFIHEKGKEDTWKTVSKKIEF